MSIVTRTGDKGETGLYGGQRVSKDDVRIEAIGTVDELNAVLGMVIATSPIPQPLPPMGAGEHEDREYRAKHQVNGSVLLHARDMRKNPTNAEEYLWTFLRFDQLGVRFRRQHPVAGRILDFYCHKVKLGIEVDGPIHDDPTQKENDEDRTVEMDNEGIQIIRFKNEEVLNDIEHILAVIRLHISSPPPSGEGLGVGEAVQGNGGDSGEGEVIDKDIHACLIKTQNVLFTLGADLATPHENNKAIVPRIEQKHIDELEGWIAKLEEKPLPPYFILPGGSKTASELHVARAVCRRAERLVVSLSKQTTIGIFMIKYLNRLSDYLFLAALEANREEGVDNIRVSYT